MKEGAQEGVKEEDEKPESGHQDRKGLGNGPESGAGVFSVCHAVLKVVFVFLAFGQVFRVTDLLSASHSPSHSVPAHPLLSKGLASSANLIVSETTERAAHLLIAGDSRSHVGLDPKPLSHFDLSESRGAFIARNISEDGSGVLRQCSLLLREIRKQIPQPQAVIWAVNPLTFDKRRIGPDAARLGFRELGALIRAKAPLETILEVVSGAVLPAMKYRGTVGAALEKRMESLVRISIGVQKRLPGVEYIPPTKDREYLREVCGFEPFRILDWNNRFQKGCKNYEEKYRTLKIPEATFAIAEDFMQTLVRRGVRLLVLEMPVAPWYRENLSDQQSHRKWRERMRTIAERSGCAFWDDSGWAKDDRQFGDPGHMEWRSAASYSRGLAQRLHAAYPEFRSDLTEAEENSGKEKLGAELEPQLDAKEGK